MKQYFLLLIGFTITFSSCKKSTDTIAPQPLAAANYTEISYGSDPAQKMDIYLPAARTTTSTKTLILIHGGAWSAGDKTDLNPFIDSLKRRMPGYAIFNINYRLATFTGANLFPAQETDVKRAVDFINGKKADYVISDKFVLLGQSAGSHLALLQAYKYSTPSIKAVVDFFGPTDMVDMYNNPASSQAPAAGIALLLGGPPPSALYTSSSPINYVTNSVPPTIIFHGGVDQLVRVQQSTTLQASLSAHSVTNQYVYYPTEGHGWSGADLTDSFDKLQAFITLYVQ